MAKEKKLTPKQETFVQEYLIDLNATQAAIRAGYSEKTANNNANQLMVNNGIAEAIKLGLEKRANKLEITSERVLQEYAKLGFADLRKIVDWRVNSDRVLVNQDGEEVTCPENFIELTPSADLDDETAAALSEVSMSKDGTLKVKLHDKKGALDSMARHLGMFIDRHEHSGPNNGPLQFEDMTLNEQFRRFSLFVEDGFREAGNTDSAASDEPSEVGAK